MFQSPFSFEGRIRRSEFGISLIIYMICYAILNGIMSSEGEGIKVLGIIFIPMVWFLWAQGAKRCHDLGKSGFWQLIPFYALWMIFQEGQQFTNEYGDNPKGISVNTYGSPETTTSSSNTSDGGYDSSYNGGHNNPGHTTITNPNTYSNQQPPASRDSGYKSGDLYK
jgi:uncharacterized membrane protein YhaH (DUF805 family)